MYELSFPKRPLLAVKSLMVPCITFLADASASALCPIHVFGVGVNVQAAQICYSLMLRPISSFDSGLVQIAHV